MSAQEGAVSITDKHGHRILPTDPPCPRCGRRYATKYYKPHAQRPSFHCDPQRPISGCGAMWTP